MPGFQPLGMADTEDRQAKVSNGARNPHPDGALGFPRSFTKDFVWS